MIAEQPEGRVKNIAVSWACAQLTLVRNPAFPWPALTLWVGFHEQGVLFHLWPIVRVEREWSAEQQGRIVNVPLVGPTLQPRPEQPEAKVN